jgi:hypothetical protein
MHEHLHRALNNFCFRREWVHPCRQPHCTTETHRRRACLTTQTEESSHFFLSWSVHIPRTPALGIFPYFDLFNQYLRIEPVQNFFFSNLALLSHASWYDLWRSHVMYISVTHGASAWSTTDVAPVAPYSLVWLTSRAVCSGVTKLWLLKQHKSRQTEWQDWCSAHSA